MEDVVVISRAGRASVPPEVHHALHGRLRFVQRDHAPNQTEAAALLEGARVLGATNVTLPPLDERLLASAPELRHVVLYATGYEHIDIDLLSAYDVTLTTLPEYATRAVAEHALALILASASRLHLANDKARGWSPRDVSLRGFELCGRQIAVVGVGRIGTQVVGLAGALGMRVVGVDIDPVAISRAESAGLTMRSLHVALAGSDVVVIAASTGPHARPILGPAELGLIPAGGVVVNVGRPVLVDNDAIRRALVSRHLRGYAVDEIVFDPDRVDDAALIAEGRVLQTAHSAWWRDEVLARGARMFGEALCAAAAGAPISTVAAPRSACVPAG